MSELFYLPKIAERHTSCATILSRQGRMAQHGRKKNCTFLYGKIYGDKKLYTPDNCIGYWITVLYERQLKFDDFIIFSLKYSRTRRELENCRHCAFIIYIYPAPSCPCNRRTGDVDVAT